MPEGAKDIPLFRFYNDSHVKWTCHYGRA